MMVDWQLAPPSLEVLKLCPDGLVRLPQAVYNTWLLHPRFKAEAEYANALDRISKDLGYEHDGSNQPGGAE